MALLRKKFRRKEEGKTDYKLRLSLIKSGNLRFVVRKTNKNIIAQIIQFNADGDKVLIGVDSNSLRKYGWKYNRDNIPCAYLTGYLCGLEAIKKKVKEAIIDIGMHTSIKKGRLFSAIKGAIDAGLKINCDNEALPDEKRLFGSHLKIKDIKNEVNKIVETIKNEQSI